MILIARPRKLLRSFFEDEKRVFRPGSWDHGFEFHRHSYRMWGNANEDDDRRVHTAKTLGFRIVMRMKKRKKL